MEWHDQTQWYKILFVGDVGEYKKKKKKKNISYRNRNHKNTMEVIQFHWI